MISNRDVHLKFFIWLKSLCQFFELDEVYKWDTDSKIPWLRETIFADKVVK